MAEKEMLVDREDDSRFALNYNKQTTETLFRLARAGRLLGKGEKLNSCTESEYIAYYEAKPEQDKSMPDDSMPDEPMPDELMLDELMLDELMPDEAREEGKSGRRRKKPNRRKRTERKKGKKLKADFVVRDGTKLIDFRLSTGFSTFKTLQDLEGKNMNHIWLLEKGTPIPEELQVINDDGNHVKIMPDERTPVTVEKFKEMLCCLNWVKMPTN